ncbi:hypothetical protein [Jeotgalicoccus marinus]|uniref:hypothetical protein n=1 Tax=Jeotgalicoccus marinus TaxID=516700 RepID=UPI000418B1F3|nr:hypothetical protein [Jeotgalicoccus marinus]
MKMIDAQQVLELFDKHTGYITDEYSRKVLNSLDKNDKGKHVTIRRYMKRYIDSYIDRKYREKHNRVPITDEERDTIIKITGAQTSMKYEEKGILNMLKDKKINNLLQAEFEKNTIQFEGRRVPKVVKDYYFAEANGVIEEVEFEIQQSKYFKNIKDDSTDELKMKLYVIEQEIRQRKLFEDMIKEYDEVKDSRSPESIYYFEIEE